MKRKMHMACNFSSLIETIGLLKVTCSQLQRKSANISEAVQDMDVLTTDH